MLTINHIFVQAEQRSLKEHRLPRLNSETIRLKLYQMKSILENVIGS